MFLSLTQQDGIIFCLQPGGADVHVLQMQRVDQLPVVFFLRTLTCTHTHTRETDTHTRKPVGGAADHLWSRRVKTAAKLLLWWTLRTLLRTEQPWGQNAMTSSFYARQDKKASVPSRAFSRMEKSSSSVERRCLIRERQFEDFISGITEIWPDDCKICDVLRFC